MFFEVEKKHHDLEKQGDGASQEREGALQEWHLRMIWTDIVESAVGFAHLKLYIALFNLHEMLRNLRCKWRLLSRGCLMLSQRPCA